MVHVMSKTNCLWGTERSLLIGVSAICYVAPAVLDAIDGRPRLFVWLLQALACFWSDYIDSGRYGFSHCFDKILAFTLTIHVAGIALKNGGLLYAITIAIPTFGCYGLSTAARKAGNRDRYALFHSLWHLCGAIVTVATLNLAR